MSSIQKSRFDRLKELGREKASYQAVQQGHTIPRKPLSTTTAKPRKPWRSQVHWPRELIARISGT